MRFPGTRSASSGRLIPTSGRRLGNSITARFFKDKTYDDSPAFFAGAVTRTADTDTIGQWIRWTDVPRLAGSLENSYFYHKNSLYTQRAIDIKIDELKAQILQLHMPGSGEVDLLNIDSHIIPDSNELYNLGSPQHGWSTLYVNEIKFAPNSLIKSNTGNPDNIDFNTPIANFSQNISVGGSVGAGYFVGDGAGLTGVTAEWDGTHTGNALFDGNVTVGSQGLGDLNVMKQIKVTDDFHLVSASQPGSWSMLSWSDTAGRTGNFDLLTVNGGLLNNGGYGFARIGAVEIGGNDNIDSIKDLVNLTMSGDLIAGECTDPTITDPSSCATSGETWTGGTINGNLVGNVTGNITGDIIGDVTGSISGGTLAGDGTSVTNVSAEDSLKLGGYSSSWYTTYTDNAVSALVDGADDALDTLKELGEALGDDSNFAGTITTSIANEATVRATADTAEVTARTNADSILQTDIDTKVPLSGSAVIYGDKTFQNTIQGALSGNTSGIHTGAVVGDVAGNVTTPLITFSGNNTTLDRNPTEASILLNNNEYHALMYDTPNPIWGAGMWGMVTWTNNEDECMCGPGGSYDNISSSCNDGTLTDDYWNSQNENNQGFYQPSCWTKRINANVRALIFDHKFDGSASDQKAWWQDNVNKVGLLIKIWQETDPAIWKIFRILDTPNTGGTCEDLNYLDQATCEANGYVWAAGYDAIPFYIEEFGSSEYCSSCGPQASWNTGSSVDLAIEFVGFGGPKATKIEGDLTGHLIPVADDLYDIGSAEFKVRDLYVSENSLWVGETHKMDTSSGSMKFRKRKTGNLPAGISAAGGNEAGALTHSGKGSLELMSLAELLAYRQSLAGGEGAGMSSVYPAEGSTNYDASDYDEINTLGQSGSSYRAHSHKVVGISTKLPGSGLRVGSGFVMEIDAGSGAQQYIITNGHVVLDDADFGTCSCQEDGGLTDRTACETAGHTWFCNGYVGGFTERIVSWVDPGGVSFSEENPAFLGWDPKTDVAVLTVTQPFADHFLPGNNSQMTLGSAPGSSVTTIGNPFGRFAYSITEGVIRDAHCDDYSWMTEAIKVDYETVGGNSGGPIIGQNGKVLGMHTWAHRPLTGEEPNQTWAENEDISGGIGINALMWSAIEIITQKAASPGPDPIDISSKRSGIGIKYETMNLFNLNNFNFDNPYADPAITNAIPIGGNYGLNGCVVTALAAGSVAAAGGLELNDIITDVDVQGVGYSVGPQNDDYSLARLLGELAPNTPVTINYKDSNDQWNIKTVVINTIGSDSLNVMNDDSDNGLKLRSSWV